MSIAWVNFTSNCVVDLLKLFGFITTLPQALLSLTVLSWGNSLGDVSADVALTKKGFGEMAITATMAGPLFNILVG
jgi:sodium/potassium/calcium exchanger 6